MHEPPQGSWPPPREAWYAVTVLMVAYLFSYVDRQILSMLVGPIKADLGLRRQVVEEKLLAGGPHIVPLLPQVHGRGILENNH